MGVGDRAVLIENVMGGDVDPTPGPGRDALRAAWGLTPTQPVVLYTGTFEQYQGLDLLLEASVRLKALVPDVAVLVVGGDAEQVSDLAARAAAAGAPLVFTGPASAERRAAFRRRLRRPRVAAHLRHQHAAQDLFVSPLGPADRRDQPAYAHAGAHARVRGARRADSRRARGRPRRASCRIARPRRGLPRRRTNSPTRATAGSRISRARARRTPCCSSRCVRARAQSLLPGPPRPGDGSRGDGAGHGRHRIHRRASCASPGAPGRDRARPGAAAEPRPARSGGLARGGHRHRQLAT